MKVRAWLAVPLLIAGCAASPYPKVQHEATQVAKEKGQNLARYAEPQRVVEYKKAYIPVVGKAEGQAGFLQDRRVSLKLGGAGAPVPLSEVVRSLSRQGLNISSDLPLDKYVYSGFGVHDTDAETALKLILGPIGLDFTADGQRQTILIKPLSSKTWFLNIGNRKAAFASGAKEGAGSVTTGAPPTATLGAYGALPPNGTAISTSTLGSGTGQATVAAQDDFWASLKTELEARLKVLVPEPKGAAGQVSLPPLPMPAGAAPGAAPLPPPQVPTVGAGEGSLYQAKTMGAFALNPETGAVTVQAPHWVLNDLDAYFKRVQDMYNSDITFSGEILILSATDNQSEGFEIAGFTTFLKNVTRTGLAFSNNGLGGVTISGLENVLTSPSTSAVSDLLQSGRSVLGGGVLKQAGGKLEGLSLFNAYLSTFGKVTVVQKPVITTTSGIPSDFRRTITRYYNTVTQQAATGGTGSAAVGTQNTLVPIELGTVLRVNPRIDLTTGLIRAQITLEQTTQSGVQNITQSLTAGNSLQQVDTAVPVLSRIVYSGEALLKDGDLIVMGGQSEDSATQGSDGVTGLKDGPLAPLFGKKTEDKSTNVFYFALTVHVNRR